jgi:hypothetical protein
METTEILTSPGITTREFPVEAYLFQPFLPNLKPDFPLTLPEGIPTIEEAENIADNLTAILNQDELPVDLEAILTYCGVTRIHGYRNPTARNGLSLHGFIEEAGDGYFIIRLKSNDPKDQQIFTKSHELGHRILHETTFPISGFRTGEKNGYENEGFAIEGFCDDIGRMMLAPRRLLAPRFEQIRDSFIRFNHNSSDLSGNILDLFDDTQLPPSQFIWRLSGLGLWKGEGYNSYQLQQKLEKHLKESN